MSEECIFCHQNKENSMIKTYKYYICKQCFNEQLVGVCYQPAQQLQAYDKLFKEFKSKTIQFIALQQYDERVATKTELNALQLAIDGYINAFECFYSATLRLHIDYIVGQILQGETFKKVNSLAN